MLEHRGSVRRHAPAAWGTSLLAAAAVVGTQLALAESGNPRAPVSPYGEGGFTVGVADVDRRITITSADDGSYVLGHTPAGGDVVLDLDLLSGDTVQPWWYDPRTGRTLKMRTLGSEGVARFPVPEEGGGPDWVLVVDDVAAGYGAPDPDVVAQATGDEPAGTDDTTGNDDTTGTDDVGDPALSDETESGRSGPDVSDSTAESSPEAWQPGTGSTPEDDPTSSGRDSEGTISPGGGEQQQGGEQQEGGEEQQGGEQQQGGEEQPGGEDQPGGKGRQGGEQGRQQEEQPGDGAGEADEDGAPGEKEPGAEPASGRSPEDGRFGGADGSTGRQEPKDQQSQQQDEVSTPEESTPEESTPEQSTPEQREQEPGQQEPKAGPAPKGNEPTPKKEPTPPPKKEEADPTPTNEPAADGSWDKLAECESSGDWAINTGNGYYGGLQFDSATWNDFGGTKYAPRADKASKEQQIEIASKVRDARGGYRSWPACSSKLGLPK